MEIIFVVCFAYGLTGVHCIISDLRKPYHDRPAYARNPSRYLKGFLLMIVGWLPLTLLMAQQYRLWGKAFSTLLIFAFLSVSGILLL